MKFPKLPLHVQILAAMVLGTIFGIIFSVPEDTVNIETKRAGKKISNKIEKWESILFLDNEGEVISAFKPIDKLGMIKNFKRNKEEVEAIRVFKQGRKEEETGIDYKNVSALSDIETLATQIKPVGTVFIRLLSFLAIPLVLATLIIGASSITDIKKLGRIGLKTFSIYILTTAIAITIGLLIANTIQPGNQLDSDTKARLIGAYGEDNPEAMVEKIDIDIIDFFVNIIPKNPFQAIAESEMLQIVFFALIFGIMLTFIEREKAMPVINFFNAISETMIKMVDFIMKLAPYGVFALIAATIAEFGYNILETLIWYILSVVAGLLLHTFLVYGTLVKVVGKVKPGSFLSNMKTAQAIAFSTSSSAATLPVTIDCVENKIGVPKHISGFVLPLGATVNMDGTALYQGVAAVFIAQVYGFDLTITEQLTIVLTAVLASIGTAPVPGVGIIMLVIILQSINVPAEGIALILGVDRILDMMRTVTNVTGDAAVAIAVAGSEN